MIWLTLKSWLLLLYFDVLMLTRDFNVLHARVSKEPVRTDSTRDVPPSDMLSRSMDYACVLYFKQVLCLQRSAATTLLFRRYGLAAEMIIGVQLLPFKSPLLGIADAPPTSAVRSASRSSQLPNQALRHRTEHRRVQERPR